MENTEEVVAPTVDPASYFEYTGHYVRPLHFFTGNAYSMMLSTPKSLRAVDTGDSVKQKGEEKEDAGDDAGAGSDDADDGDEGDAKKQTRKKKYKHPPIYHLHSCVLSQLFDVSIEALESFVDMYLDKKKTVPLASLYLAKSTTDGASSNDHKVTITVDRLQLALNQLVKSKQNRDMTRSELLALLRPLVMANAPIAIVNWIISFGNNRSSEYRDMCNSTQEPNWLHATLADIGAHRGIHMDTLLNHAASYSVGSGRPPIDGEPIVGTPAMFYANIYLSGALSDTDTDNLRAIPMSVRPTIYTAMGTPLSKVMRHIFTDDTLTSPTTRTLAITMPPMQTSTVPRTLFKSLIAATPFSLTSFVDTVCAFYHFVLHSNPAYNTAYTFTDETNGLIYGAPIFEGNNVLTGSTATRSLVSAYPEQQPTSHVATLSALVNTRYLRYAMKGNVTL